jgi:hypothetical protein
MTAKKEGSECRHGFSSDSSTGSTDSGSSGVGSLLKKRLPFFLSAAGETDEGHEQGCSRKFSKTSQVSKSSGYSSFKSQSQHRNQSSSEDSGRIRNPRPGSGLSRTKPLDQAKAVLERRKKASEQGSPQARVEATRVNADSLIDEILRSTNLEPEDEFASGLQLSIAKDGTAVLGSHGVKSQMPAGVFTQLVIDPDKW